MVMPKRPFSDLSINSSKRRRNDSGSFAKPSENSEIDTVLRSIGVRRSSVANNSCGFELLQDMNRVQESIQNLFKTNKDKTWNVLSSSLKETSFLTLALSPLACVEGISEPAGGSRSYTLMRCFLECPEVQDVLSTLLIQHVVTADQTNENISHMTDEASTASRILAQFRWIAFSGERANAIVNQLLELLEALPSGPLQHDLISLLPELATTASLVTLVADRLNQLLLTDPRQELATVIFDALTDLPLDAAQREEIKGTAVGLLDGSPVVTLPTLVKYLLQSTSCDAQADREALCTQLRAGIDWECFALAPLVSSTQLEHGTQGLNKSVIGLDKDKTPAEHASAAVLTADVIRVHCTFQKGLADSWVRVISESTENLEEKAVSDFIQFLILHPLAKTKTVETAVRNRIRSQIFTPATLLPVFKGHKAILKAHFPALISLAQGLLPPKEHAKSDPVSAFASTLYSYAFASLPSYYQQEVVGALVTHVGSLLKREADVALATLADLAIADPVRMQPFSVFVKSLFDGVESLSGSQVRRLYSILSCLAFRTGNQTALREELHILIRKQLGHVTPFYRSLGVIGAVTMIQYLVNSTGDTENPGSPASSLSTSSTASSNSCPPPVGASKEVVRLLRMVRSSYARLPALGCLFMDELYGLLITNALESGVESWVAETVMRDFQNDFVIDNGMPEDLSDKDWCLKYSLDKETECEIAVNFGPLWFRSLGVIDSTMPSNESTIDKRIVSPLCVAPHFRLLCLCERRCQGGNLEGIDALLGCPLLLPKDFADQPSLLALIINWLIEVLNGFCEQDTDEMRAKLLWRLHQVVDLRRQLFQALVDGESAGKGRCYAGLQRHSLPRVVFESGSDWALSAGMVRVVKSQAPAVGGHKLKKKKAGKQKSLKKSLVDSDSDAEPTTNASRAPDHVSKALGLVDRHALRLCFRELSVHCARMLGFEKVCVLNLNSISSSVDKDESVCLRHDEAAFLLADLRSKLAYRLAVAASTPFGGAVSDEHLFHRHLDAGVQDLELVRFFVRLLPSLRRRLDLCIDFLRGETAPADEEDTRAGLVDTESEEGRAVVASLCHILDCARLVAAWLDRPAAKAASPLEAPLLGRVLRLLAAGEGEEDSVERWAPAVTRYLASWTDALPHIHAAALHCELVVSSGRWAAGTAGEDVTVQEYTLELLNREWDASAEWEGRKYRDALHSLVQAHFGAVQTSKRAEFVQQMASNHLQSVVESGGRCPAYTTLCHSSFPIFYRAALVQALQVAKAASTGAAPSGEKLARWGRVVDIFAALMNLVRQQSETANVAALVKAGKQFVQVMLRDAMPLMDNVFRARQDEVSSLLKRIQQVTRFLQHLCGHCKGSKDASLAGLVPQLKRFLEAFIYRVKIMLSSNNCGEAFWLGNLKNRNLQGDEIHSDEDEEESTVATTEDRNEDDGGDENGEEDVDNLNLSSNSDSDSSVSDSY